MCFVDSFTSRHGSTFKKRPSAAHHTPLRLGSFLQLLDLVGLVELGVIGHGGGPDGRAQVLQLRLRAAARALCPLALSLQPLHVLRKIQIPVKISLMNHISSLKKGEGVNAYFLLERGAFSVPAIDLLHIVVTFLKLT